MEQDSHHAQNMNQNNNPDKKKMNQYNNAAGEVKPEETHTVVKEIKEESPDKQNIKQDSPYEQNMNKDNIQAMDKISQDKNSAGEMERGQAYGVEKEVKQDFHNAQNMNIDKYPSLSYSASEKMPFTRRGRVIDLRDRMDQDNNLAGEIDKGGAFIVEKEIEAVNSDSPMLWRLSVDCWLAFVNLYLVVIAVGQISIYGQKAAKYSVYIAAFGSLTLYIAIIGTVLFTIGTCKLQSCGFKWWEDSERNRNKGICFLNVAFFILALYFILEIMFTTLTLALPLDNFTFTIVIADLIWTLANGFIFLYVIPMLIMKRRGYNVGWPGTMKKMFKHLSNCDFI